MLDVYLAVGHGVEPDGVYDPGAIGADGRQEHLEAYQVCVYALTAMRRSGLSVVSESAEGASHDPDYRGSTTRANALNPRVAVEVHFDWSGGVDGFSGLYFSDAGHRLAEHIGQAFVARHLPRMADVERPELYFLNSTNMPALIPEIRRVHDYPDSENRAQGEAIAEGICAFLGHPFRPPASPAGGSGSQGGGSGDGDGDGDPVTADSPLLAAPRASAAHARAYLLAQAHGAYDDADVDRIVGLYYQVAPAVGLDPLLVVAQMSEETEHLSSFWSQRPRRNLAGIGVTGEPGVGLSFPDLATAVRAHTGRLLAYALAADACDPAQTQLIAEALAFRPLPDNLRGSARHLSGLATTWAADPQYATKIAAVARDIRHQTPGADG